MEIGTITVNKAVCTPTMHREMVKFIEHSGLPPEREDDLDTGRLIGEDGDDDHPEPKGLVTYRRIAAVAVHVDLLTMQFPGGVPRNFNQGSAWLHVLDNPNYDACIAQNIKLAAQTLNKVATVQRKRLAKEEGIKGLVALHSDDIRSYYYYDIVPRSISGMKYLECSMNTRLRVIATRYRNKERGLRRLLADSHRHINRELRSGAINEQDANGARLLLGVLANHCPLGFVADSLGVTADQFTRMESDYLTRVHERDLHNPPPTSELSASAYFGDYLRLPKNDDRSWVIGMRQRLASDTSDFDASDFT